MNEQEFGTCPTFLSIAFNGEVWSVALKVAAVVGTILCLINHLPDFVQGTFGMVNMVQIALTYSVPFCVSTYSSVRAIRRFCLPAEG